MLIIAENNQVIKTDRVVIRDNQPRMRPGDLAALELLLASAIEADELGDDDVALSGLLDGIQGFVDTMNAEKITTQG